MSATAEERQALGQLHHRCELVRAALAGDPFELAQAGAAAEGFEELGQLLRRLEALKAAAATAASLVNALMADVAPSDLEVVPNLATFERVGGGERKKWNHEAALADVYAWALDPANRAVEEGEPGELVDPAEAVRDAIMAAGAFSYWRVKAMKAMGLKADRYCEVTYGSRHVIPRWVEPLEAEREPEPAVERRGPADEAVA